MSDTLKSTIEKINDIFELHKERALRGEETDKNQQSYDNDTIQSLIWVVKSRHQYLRLMADRIIAEYVKAEKSHAYAKSVYVLDYPHDEYLKLESIIENAESLNKRVISWRYEKKYQ